MSSCQIDVSYGIDSCVPTQTELIRWAHNALHGLREGASVAIRVVDNAESQVLNHDYRGKDYPTNVLSFPADIHPEVELDHLGDIVICAPVVEAEAAQQGKELGSHWAHMVTHGVLHLLGHDHIEEPAAEAMESLERDILARLAIADPY